MGESEFPPRINFRAEGGPGGPPLPSPENEARRSSMERANLYPMSGGDVIKKIRNTEVGEGGEIGEVKKVLRGAFAYKEGLRFGLNEKFYKLDNHREPGAIILKGLFSTEDLKSRPQAFYLDQAIEEALEERVREYQDFEEDIGAWEKRERKEITEINKARALSGLKPYEDEIINQYFIDPKKERLENIGKAVSNLLWLHGHGKARETIDKAFLQRMGTCENPQEAAEITDKYRDTLATPDHTHWELLFRGDKEFGEGVNKALESIREMGTSNKEKLEEALARDENEPIKKWFDDLKKKSPQVAERLEGLPWNIVENDGVPTTVYTEGFMDTEMFTKWLKNILKSEEVNGRVDIAWMAWRLALLWEIPSSLGNGVVARVKKPGEVEESVEVQLKVGFPPYVSSLFGWTAHLEDKKAIEFGLEIDGSLSEERVTHYISHSGLPLAIGRGIKPLCSSYLHEAPIYLPNGEKKKLWEIWQSGVSLASDKFPWMKTEIGETEDAGELPSGSFGEWQLRRTRAWAIVGFLRSRPDTNDLLDPDFFIKISKNWDKVSSLKKDTPPEESERTWWLAAAMWNHIGGTDRKLKDEEEFRNFRSFAQGTLLNEKEKGVRPEGAKGTAGDILHHAVSCGFIREKDKIWIAKKLGINLTDY